jgi:sulfite reductase (NADPH) hemoprotein beta-component
VLGVDKKRKDGQPDEEWYQVSIGGSQGLDASVGEIVGPAFSRDEVPDVVEWLLDTYVQQRYADERFIDTVRRVGVEPFKLNVERNRRPRLAAAA